MHTTLLHIFRLKQHSRRSEQPRQSSIVVGTQHESDRSTQSELCVSTIAGTNAITDQQQQQEQQRRRQQQLLLRPSASSSISSSSASTASFAAFPATATCHKSRTIAEESSIHRRKQ